jgi:5-methylcytosine-specific restriction endonuclease McrA
MYPKNKPKEDKTLLKILRNNPCQVCGHLPPSVIHHVKTRGSGGGDDFFNCIQLCIKCHERVHKIGIDSFAEKHIRFYNWLLQNGWERNDTNGRWRHYTSF